MTSPEPLLWSAIQPRTPPEVPASEVPSGLDEPTHHSRYYLQDGVIFLVENVLFKVPRYMLVKESSVFMDMFSLCSRRGAEGSSDVTPIHLLQVTSVDFARLLEVLYPLSIFGFDRSTTFWGEAEWKSVLHLATRWQMFDIRSVSIAKLSECASAISKIYLGRQYDHSPWIRDGFLDLCIREHPLNVDEASELNIPEIIGIAAAREKIRSHVVLSTCERKRIDTKYGPCLGYRTYQDSDSLKSCSQHKMVHDILDNTFDLDNLTTNLFSRPSPVYSLAPTSLAAHHDFVSARHPAQPASRNVTHTKSLYNE